MDDSFLGSDFMSDMFKDEHQNNYGDFDILFSTDDRFQEIIDDRFQEINDDRYKEINDDRFKKINDDSIDRFHEINDEDVENVIHQEENSNTKKNTTNDMRNFQEFLNRTGERNPPHLLSADDLSKIVSRFILSVRKKDGCEYEPPSVRGFYSLIDRHLRQNNYPLSLVNNREFSKCKEALKSKQKQLKSEGKGNKPQTAEELTDEDINPLYENGQLGTSTPHALINTLWLNNMLYFGMGCGAAQFRVGRYPARERGRWQALSPLHPVTTNQNREYSNRKSSSMNGPDDTVFLAINDANTSSSGAWFKRQNMAINKIYSLMKTMKTKAHLPENRKLTKHSARKL